MKETIKLKIEAFYIWLARGSTKAAVRYCLARRSVSRAVTEAKMGVEGVWRGHGEGLQCGFHPGCGTVEQLFTFSRLLEVAWEFTIPV